MSVMVPSPRIEKVAQKLRSNAALPYADTTWGTDAYLSALDRLGSVSITDVDGRIIYVNQDFVRISKYSRNEVIGKTHHILNSQHHTREYFQDIYTTIGAGRVWRAPIRNRAKDGSLYWMDQMIVPLRDFVNETAGYLSFGIDITRAVGTHIALDAHSKRLQAVLDQFPGGIAVYDHELNMVLCNERQKQLLDYPAEMFEGGMPSLEQILHLNASRGEYGEGDVATLVDARLALARRNEQHIYERRRPNGLHLEVRGTPLAGGGFVSTHFDITDRKRDQDTISRLAQHDPLTGLPNRNLMKDRMDKGLARVQRGDTLSLLCLDLDHFKPVNDLLGHPIGDKLLVAVARRLENCVRQTDTVARLGGDEFAIILVGTRSAEDVALVAQRIIDEVSMPYRIDDNTISIGTSVGISLAPDDAGDTAQLMKNADLALYKAKGAGRGKFAFFEQSMHDRVRNRHIIEMGLRDALANNDFKVHYQPIVRCEDRKVVSCEALIRWSHPEHGLISAADFIPVAEETGLIGKIGEWVLQAACRDAAHWPSEITVAVNISAAQFRGGDIVKSVKKALNGLDPSRLVLEITESLLMRNTHAISNTLAELRALGVQFALDDFGTGYSSLSYLQSFPFDKLKIDRSFVSSQADQARSATLRSAIFQLGANLGMTTVAEGVETEEQFAQLKAEKCVLAQGYLFSKAVPTDELQAYISRRLPSTT